MTSGRTTALAESVTPARPHGRECEHLATAHSGSGCQGPLAAAAMTAPDPIDRHPAWEAR